MHHGPMSFPGRPDFTGMSPGAAWFLASGNTANFLDRQASESPLVVQTRSADILYRLNQILAPDQPYFPNWARWGDRVLWLLESQATLSRFPVSSIRQDREQRRRISPDTLRFAVWLSLGTGGSGSPSDIVIPQGAILPSYNDPALLQGMEPSAAPSSIPFRATWWRRAVADLGGSSITIDRATGAVSAQSRGMNWSSMGIVAVASGAAAYLWAKRAR